MVYCIAGPLEIVEMTKYWSERKGDEKPLTRHQKKEALRMREAFLSAEYGWNAIERVDPTFTGGTSIPRSPGLCVCCVRSPSLASVT